MKDLLSNVGSGVGAAVPAAGGAAAAAPAAKEEAKKEESAAEESFRLIQHVKISQRSSKNFLLSHIVFYNNFHNRTCVD